MAEFVDEQYEHERQQLERTLATRACTEEGGHGNGQDRASPQPASRRGMLQLQQLRVGGGMLWFHDAVSRAGELHDFASVCEFGLSGRAVNPPNDKRIEVALRELIAKPLELPGICRSHNGNGVLRRRDARDMSFPERRR